MMFSDLVSQAAKTYEFEKMRDKEAAAREQEKLEELRAEHSAKLKVLSEIATWGEGRILEATFATMAYGADLVLRNGKWLVLTEQVYTLDLDSSDGLLRLGTFDFAQVAKRVVELSDEYDLELPWIPVELDSKPPG
jgi:hypothetical protein